MSGKVYIGNIKEDTQKEDVEDAMRKFGQVRSVWIARKPPGFGFVEFEDHRDAEDACKELDGIEMDREQI